MGLISYIRKVANQIASSYSLADKAKALTIQQQYPTTANNPIYSDGQQYSPGQPLAPLNQGKPPWQWQYTVGRNLIITPRSEDPRLTPFQVLRTLAETHDITAICIKMMIDQICGDEWDIIPAVKEDKNNYKQDIEEVKHFFWKPDRVHLFPDWLKMYLYDILTIDAGCLYKRRTRNGKLYALEIVDGSTIKPLIDAYGHVPQPPNAAYQQIIYGYPYGSTDQIPGFTTDEVVYRPRYPRSWTPYGFAPTEQLLMKINIMLRRDDFHLRYYTRGALPDAGLFQVEADWTPEQIQQYQELWNDVMSGNINERLAMRFVPKGTYTPTKEFKFDPKVDEWTARLVAISFGVNPQAFILVMTRATGELQDQQQTDIGLQPLETFLAAGLTDIIQNDLKKPHLRFAFTDEKREDARVTVERNIQYVTRGLRSIDEIRAADGLPPATDLPDGLPPMVLLGNDVIFLTKEFVEAKMKAQMDALKAGDYQLGNVQNLNIRTKQAQEAAQNSTQDNYIVQDKKDAQKAFNYELRQFEKFALNRLKKKTKREFEPNVLPAELVKEMNARLRGLNQPEEIKKLFAKVEQTKKQYDLMSDHADEISNALEDLKDYMLDNVDSITESELANKDDVKKALLLLLLWGNFDFMKTFETPLTNMLEDYANLAFAQAESEIARLGEFNITNEQKGEIITGVVNDRIAFLLPALERTTRDMVARSITSAQTVEALKQAIQNAYATSHDRADNIADVEYRTIEGQIRIAAAKASNIVAAVLVSDGTEFDGPCIDANGQVWSLDYAEEHVLQHPHCVRQFTFLTQDEADALNGAEKE